MNNKTMSRLCSTLLCLTIALSLRGDTRRPDAVESLPYQAGDMYDGRIMNVSRMYPFFEKLVRLEQNKEGKVNIVHIGDSHIQSDFLTNAARQPLQRQFGNGGYGFTFPYRLAKGGSGTGFLRYVSNVEWQSCRNNQPSKCEPGTEFGLCGYGFSTRANPFVISVSVNEAQYKFNTIKVVTSGVPSTFILAAADGNPVIQSVQSSVKHHRIRSGETLVAIAKKYNVSIANIMKENGMKSNYIYAGRNLRIPVEIKEVNVDMSLFKPLEYARQEQYVAEYYRKEPVSEIYLLPSGDGKQKVFSLNGLVVENDAPGIIYHGIGTVGSKVSDFNATPLFFKQLPVLSPDLAVVSFGTNESYGGVSAVDFVAQIDLLVRNIKKVCPDVPVLVMTPPTSLLRREALNTLASEYSASLLLKKDVSLWDLYSFTGGLMGAHDPAAIQIAADKVHYTAQGYASQGTAFARSIVDEYEQYKAARDTLDKGVRIIPGRK